VRGSSPRGWTTGAGAGRYADSKPAEHGSTPCAPATFIARKVSKVTRLPRKQEMAGSIPVAGSSSLT